MLSFFYKCHRIDTCFSPLMAHVWLRVLWLCVSKARPRLATAWLHCRATSLPAIIATLPPHHCNPTTPPPVPRPISAALPRHPSTLPNPPRHHGPHAYSWPHATIARHHLLLSLPSPCMSPLPHGHPSLSPHRRCKTHDLVRVL